MGDFKQSRTKVPNLTVSGDLTIEGDTTTISTTNTVVKDKLIELNNGATSNSNDCGIIIERGSTGDNAIVAWDESADSFIVGTTTATGASTDANLTITPTALNTGDITVGSGAAADTKIVFDGNAQDYRIGIDDGTDTLEIGHGSAHGTNKAIVINSSGQITQLGHQTSPTSGHFLKFDGSKIIFDSVSSGGGADVAQANTFTEAQSIAKDVNGEFEALILKNTDDDNDGDGLVSLRFDLEDTGGNAVDSGKIAVKKKQTFTATASTQDSKMVFSTSLNGTLTERMTLDSDGVLTCDAGVTAGSTVITDDSIVMTPSSGDTATIAAGANGTLTITTVDTAAAAANVGFVVDGAFDIDAAGAVTIDGSAITIGGDSDVAIDIDSSTLDIDASGAITIDGASTLSIDSVDDSNLTVTASGKDLDIAVAGGGTQELRLASAGTGASAIHLNASAGGVNIDSADMIDIDAADEISITTTSADGHIELVSAHTAGVAFHIDANANASSEVQIDAGILDIDVTGAATIDAVGIALGAGSGELDLTTTGTLDVNANALDMDLTDSSSITITSSEAAEDLTIEQVGANDSSIIIQAAGTGTDAIRLNASAGSLDIDAADNITIDAADEISIATTSADGHITLTSAHTAGVAFHIDANANAGSEVQIDAGILDIDVTGAATLDATSMTTTAATQSIVASTSLTVTSPSTIITSTTSTKPTLELRNTTDGDTAAGPQLTFSKVPGNDVGEADDVALGNLLFRGIDGGNNDTTYAQMTVHSSDKSSGDEGGEFRFSVMNGGTGGAASLTEIFTIGGEDVNASTPCEVIVNEASVDCDFRVESGDKTHMLFVDAANNRVSIGDSTNDPAAILEIEGASDSAVPALKVITADVDQVGVEFALANTTAIGIDIAGSNTTTEVMKINADGLTSGDAMTINSNSSDNTARSLLKLHNNHASATGTSAIEVVQDSTGPILDATYGANGAGIALKMKEVAIDISASSSATSTATNFFPALAVPIAMQILVTSNIEDNKHITKLGTGSNDGLFANTGGSILGDGVLDATNDNLTLALNAGSEAFGNGASGIGAAQNLVITHGSNPNAGAVRATLWYYQLAVDTSG